MPQALSILFGAGFTVVVSLALVVPAIGLVFCLGLAASIPLKLMAPGAGVLAAGVLWRLIFRRRETKQPG